MFDCISNSSANLLANVILTKSLSGLWLLSGPSGSGKTTFCQKIITQAHAAGLTSGGVFCPAVYENGEKVRIDQVEVQTGKHRQLGKRGNRLHENTIGCWKMDKNVMAWGNLILSRLEEKNLIVIDEMGPLELKKGQGYQEGLRLLDEKRYQMALVVVRPNLLILAQSRWPQAQVTMLGEKLL